MLGGLFGRRPNRNPAAVAAHGVIVEPVPSYEVDPRGWAMFAGLTSAHHHFLVDSPAVIPRTTMFTGWGPALQTMRGAANIGQGRPVLPKGRTLDQSKTSTLTDPASAIFARRLARRQP